METKKRQTFGYKFTMPKLWLEKNMSKHFFYRLIFRIAFYLVLFDLAFIFMYPFIRMIIQSIKTSEDLADMTVKWLPNKVFLENYSIAINSLSFMKYFKNSVIVTLLSIIGHVVSCSFIAYGFARYKFRGREILFGLVIFSLIVPAQVLVFPLYIQYSKMSWLNTYLPITVPTFFGFGLRGGLFIFLFRQFFMGLPYELEDAARIDGCGSFRIFWNIMLPISKASILVCSVLSMVWHWNDYFEPSVYLAKSAMALLPSRLPSLFDALNAEQVVDPTNPIIYNEAIVLAATFLVILPLLIAYTFLQKSFMEGVERSGITGQ